jgi:hypothetical protein
LSTHSRSGYSTKIKHFTALTHTRKCTLITNGNIFTIFFLSRLPMFLWLTVLPLLPYLPGLPVFLFFLLCHPNYHCQQYSLLYQNFFALRRSSCLIPNILSDLAILTSHLPNNASLLLAALLQPLRTLCLVLHVRKYITVFTHVFTLLHL